jgi:hypothetical protein
MISKAEALDNIHERLRSNGSRRSSTSGNDWLCPVHEVGDGQHHSASLTVKVGDDPGKIVLRCAKCGTDPVLKALGLTFSDLHYDLESQSRTPIGEPLIYDYPDKQGQPYLRVVRQPMTVGRKETHQEHWTGSTWRNGLGGRHRVLYRLPHVLKAARKHRVIHLAEGESDADALNEWFKANKVKEFATTHPEGAGKWRDDYAPSLAGADLVVIWADRDSPGYACAEKRFLSLQSAGHAVEIRLPIPDQDKADVRDHLNAGHTPDDGKVVSLEDLVALTPEGEHDPEVLKALRRLQVQERARELHREAKADEEFRPPASDLDLAAALIREREALTYTIDRLHPTGSNSLIAAQFKVGKTTLMANLLQSYADGDEFLGEFAVHPGPGRIALFNYELTEQMLYDEYLGPMGIGSPERVAVLNLRGSNFDLRSPAAFAFAVEWLRERGCDALVLDPFGAAARLANENDNSEARNWLLGVLDPLKAAAGIRDLWMPAHTGRGQAEEGEEHVRGASAVDDWADVRWNYTKARVADENGGSWRRFLSANGRAVDVSEREIAHDKDDHSLYVSQYLSRTQLRASNTATQVVEVVTKHPGINATALKDALHGGSRDKGPAISQAMREGLIHVRIGGPGQKSNAKLYYPGAEGSDA